MTLPAAIVVRAGGKYGTGHLKRAQLIQQKLLPKKFPAILFSEKMPAKLPFGLEPASPKHYARLLSLWDREAEPSSLTPFVFSWEVFTAKIFQQEMGAEYSPSSPLFSVALLDGRDHTCEQIQELKRHCRFLFLYDDMGSARSMAHTCLDILVDRQSLSPCAGRSLSGWPYLVLNPPSTKATVPSPKSPDIVLLTGQNDPFSLERRLLSFLGTNGLEKGNHINLALFLSHEDLFTSMKTKHPTLQSDWLTVYFYGKDYNQLQGILREAKVLVSYFSLTLFEAWLMDTIPVLYAPHPYHKRLSEQLIQQSRTKGDSVFFPGEKHDKPGFDDLLLALQWTVKHYSALAQTKAKAPQGLDYGGAERIAHLIQETGKS